MKADKLDEIENWAKTKGQLEKWPTYFKEYLEEDNYNPCQINNMFLSLNRDCQTKTETIEDLKIEFYNTVWMYYDRMELGRLVRCNSLYHRLLYNLKGD